jgi:cobalt-zinc-cadmium efflux system protein
VKQTTRLSIVLALNISIITGLLFVGLSSHSLGVLAAGGDYLLDCSAITLGLLAIYIRDRANGRSKATTIVALINSVFLLIITSYVVFEAVHRLSTDTPEINALPVLIVSSIAAVVMVIGAFIIGGDDDDNDLHMRSVLLDTISDAVAAAALAITGVIILVTKGFYWADSVVALMIAIVIAYQALKLLRDVVRELRK